MRGQDWPGAWLDSSILFLPELPPFPRASILKTWCNGWFTTYRIAGSTRKCCLWCNWGPDNLTHYTVCSFLLDSWQTTPGGTFEDNPSVPPQYQILGLGAASPLALHKSSLLWQVYHRTKNERGFSSTEAARSSVRAWSYSLFSRLATELEREFISKQRATRGATRQTRRRGGDLNLATMEPIDHPTPSGN